MFQIEWARFSALHPCKLRTYHLTISTPLGLTRTILSQLNVISASNNYLLLEKKIAKGQEPTGAFDFKACLVIPEFQLGKEICSYPLRAGHSAGILMADGWRMSVKREWALWWEKPPGSSPSKMLRLDLPWMLENSLSSNTAEMLLDLLLSYLRVGNLKREIWISLALPCWEFFKIKQNGSLSLKPQNSVIIKTQ